MLSAHGGDDMQADLLSWLAKLPESERAMVVISILCGLLLSFIVASAVPVEKLTRHVVIAVFGVCIIVCVIVGYSISSWFKSRRKKRSGVAACALSEAIRVLDQAGEREAAQILRRVGTKGIARDK